MVVGAPQAALNDEAQGAKEIADKLGRCPKPMPSRVAPWSSSRFSAGASPLPPGLEPHGCGTGGRRREGRYLCAPIFTEDDTAKAVGICTCWLVRVETSLSRNLRAEHRHRPIFHQGPGPVIEAQSHRLPGLLACTPLWARRPGHALGAGALPTRSVIKEVGRCR